MRTPVVSAMLTSMLFTAAACSSDESSPPADTQAATPDTHAPAADSSKVSDEADPGATGAGDTSASMTCAQLEERFWQALPGVLEGLQACDEDKDCELLNEARLSCPSDARIATCPIGITAGRAGDFEEAMSDASVAACEGAPQGCLSTPSCAPTEARCDGGACAATVVTE